MKFGLIAASLGHSFSRELHAMIDDYDYVLRELTQEELPDFLAQRDFSGINVTIPYKQTVLPYLDRLSPEAAAVGAVNTVVNRNGVLWGHNTDVAGMIALLERMNAQLTGKKVLITGTGGAALAARAAARDLGAAQVLLVSRTGRDGALTYEAARQDHGDAAFLINATPCGMAPQFDERPVDLAWFLRLEGVADAIYHPLASRLVLEARQRGIPAEGGLYMLCAQAVEAARLFTGRDYPADLTETVYRRLLLSKQNLVLIGMPGCGKSTVGQAAAALLDRPFVDLDREIAAGAGCSIPEIFAREGEAGFRRREREAVRSAAQKTGLVIATGGGTVLSAENVEALRHNGFLLFLDRPAAELVPTADRPLADSRDKLDALYRQRLPLYRAAADGVISTASGVEETARRVIKCFTEEQDHEHSCFERTQSESAGPAGAGDLRLRHL